MINSKKKGNHWENVFANWLRDNGIKAWKDGASGGGTREKADVGNGLNIHFEVKAVKKISLDKVWKKALYECTKTHNDPVLAIHFDGMGDKKFLIVMDNDYFLDLLLKKDEEKVEANYQDPKAKYALQNLKNAITSVMKFLP